MSDKPKRTIISPRRLLQLRRLERYNLIFFIVFIAIIYGIVLLHINSLNSQQPSDQAVSGQVKAAHVLNINPSVVKQIQTLQDNSVSVQSLFDQARNNPF